MKVEIAIRLLICACITCCISSTFAGDEDDGIDGCPAGEIPDCNGNCAPFEWLVDLECDNGVREWPADSGIYIDFACEDYMCDVYNCDGCDNQCVAGEIPDCNGNCAPAIWIFDGFCDNEQREWPEGSGFYIDFSCADYGCDLGDCQGTCWNDNGSFDPNALGACCLKGVCSESTADDCWNSYGAFMGSHTLCQTGTCGCGPNWITDCAGNCIPFQWAGGQFCSNGEVVDFGMGEGTITIELDCLALACGLSGCLGTCPGACCTGAACIETPTYDSCLDLGGIFLGSFVSCVDGSIECEDQFKPIQLPDSVLQWSGKLGEILAMPFWIASEGYILVAGAMIDDDGFTRSGACVFRDVAGVWQEEALLIAPSGNPLDHTVYATDGQRIAFTVELDPGTANARNGVVIFNFDGTQWAHEQTVDNGIPSDPALYIEYGTAIDIEGDLLLVGDGSYGYDEATNYGGAYLYRFADSQWTLDATTLVPMTDPNGDSVYPQGNDQQFGMSVALGSGYAAVVSERSVWIYDVSTSVTDVQHIRMDYNNSWPGHKSLDFDGDKLLTPVAYYYEDTLRAKIYQGGSTWSEIAELIPFDATGSDSVGRIVDLDGDRALITSATDSDLGIATGSGYLWQFDGFQWNFNAKLWPDTSLSDQQFGTSAALNGSQTYMAGFPDDTQGMRVFGPRGIAWVNPLDGEITDESNWDPQAPVSGDAVSYALRTQTTIFFDDDPVFDQFNVGPGTPIIDLGGVTRPIGSGGETIHLEGVSNFPAELVVINGILNVTGNVSVGDENHPATLSIQNSIGSVAGGVHVNGFWQLNDSGTLDLELGTGNPAPLQLTGVAPQLRGVLSLNLADGYVPVAGDEIPLVTTEFVDSNTTGDFSIFMVNDPLPDGLYLRVEYSESEPYTATAIIAELSSLFGYGEPNSASVEGLATDIEVSDLGSTTRGLDGNDDIVVITADTIYIFISDALGGIDHSYGITNSTLFDSLTAVDVGDFDANGTTDIVVVNNSTNQLIPLMDITDDALSFNIGIPITTGNNPLDVLAMDANFDSIDDVIVACAGYSSADGSIDFFEYSTTFASGLTPLGSLPSANRPTNIDPGDVTNPKDLKINISFSFTNTVGQGIGDNFLMGFNWSLGPETNVAIGPTNLVSGYLDEDLYEDVVVSCPESDVICILRGQSDGTYGSALMLNVGEAPTSITLLDFDHDGDQDIAVIANDETTGQRAIFLYRNDTSLNGGNLMFAIDSSLDGGLNPILVAKGDIDGDNQDDLVSVNGGSNFRGTENENLRLRKERCVGDLDNNGSVGVDDLLLIIAAWGQTGSLPEDLDSSGVVGIDDLLIVIAAWGPCP